MYRERNLAWTCPLGAAQGGGGWCGCNVITPLIPSCVLSPHLSHALHSPLLSQLHSHVCCLLLSPLLVSRILTSLLFLFLMSHGLSLPPALLHSGHKWPSLSRNTSRPKIFRAGMIDVLNNNHKHDMGRIQWPLIYNIPM